MGQTLTESAIVLLLGGPVPDGHLQVHLPEVLPGAGGDLDDVQGSFIQVFTCSGFLTCLMHSSKK